MATLSLKAGKPLDYPLCSYEEIHVDEVNIKLPRTKGSPMYICVNGNFMGRDKNGRKQWADGDTGTASVACATDNLDKYLADKAASNPELALAGQQAVGAVMNFIAAWLSEERPDQVGDVTVAVEF